MREQCVPGLPSLYGRPGNEATFGQPELLDVLIFISTFRKAESCLFMVVSSMYTVYSNLLK